MKTLSLLLVASLLGVTLPAQKLSQEELRQLRAEKLAKPVFKKANWLTDYDAARAASKQEGKLIFAYFSRTYSSCPGCDVLENGAFSEATFREFAKTVVLLLHNTSKVDDEKYPNLAADKGCVGFPSLLFMDAEGKVIARHSGERSVQSFEALQQKASEYQQLASKAGDANTKKRLFLLQIELDMLSRKEIQTALAQTQGLTPAEAATVDQKLTDMELDELSQQMRQLGVEATCKRVTELAREGHRPSEAQAAYFWSQVLAHAQRTKDAKLGEQAFGELEKRYGKEPRFAEHMQTWRKMYADAKGSK